MNILVINAGSSSLKYQLLDPASQQVLAKVSHRTPAPDPAGPPASGGGHPRGGGHDRELGAAGGVRHCGQVAAGPLGGTIITDSRTSGNIKLWSPSKYLSILKGE